MIGAQRGGPTPKGLKTGDYVSYIVWPHAVFQIESLQPSTVVNLYVAYLRHVGGPIPTHEQNKENRDLYASGIMDSRPNALLKSLVPANEMLVLAMEADR